MRSLKDMFALTDKGAKDLKKAAASSVVADLTMMIPVGLMLMVVIELIQPLLGNPMKELNVWLFTGAAILVAAIIFAVQHMQYNACYLSAYEESANRRVTLAESLRMLPLSFFGKRDLADLTTTAMNDCTSLEATFSHSIPQLIGSVVAISVVCISLVFFDWRMALSLFAMLPVALLFVFGSKKIQDKHSRRIIEARNAASDGVQECLEGVSVVKAYDADGAIQKGLWDKFRNLEKASSIGEFAAGIFVQAGQVVLQLGIALMVLIGTMLLTDGTIDIIKFLLFVFVSSRIFDPLSIALMRIAEVFNARVKIERMREINDYPKQTGKTDPQIKGSDVVFKDVRFSYNADEVLHGITFEAKQGEVTALVGPSGSGKSTISKLAARFWDVDSGTITLGGEDVDSVDPETLLKNFSIVFQDVVLFNDTVMNNIRIGKADATDEEVLAAAKAAQCDDFVQKLPLGYDTEIGENGSTLSGGERQRISIARALLKDAPVVLLDEATASLDVENETKIQEAISNLVRSKTVMVIAHRMRTVAGADRIVVLEDGNVVEEGDHKSLMDKNGLYRKMVDLQSESAKWTPTSG